jgi:DNA helicase IV
MKLPAFEDLSKEQDLIYNLDLDGNYLVSGPPGTGKSVMALYRAQILTIDDREPAVLMYSNVLKQYTEQAANEVDVAMFVTTYNKWFWKFWRTHYRQPPPTVPGNSYEVEWTKAAERFMNEPPPLKSLADLIVDEGQDLALGFFRLAKFIAINMTVFADENQQLFENNTTLDEIAKGMGALQHLELRRNYRNTSEIAAAAATYYAGAPTGRPDPPERHGDKPTVRRYDDVDGFVDFVARYVKAKANLTIGVACPTAGIRNKIFDKLGARKLPIAVQKYDSANAAHKVLDFDSPAVTIVHYKSLKGLEFDTLFVPELQRALGDATSASMRMLFYVVMSRARDELHLSWSESSVMPPILEGLKGLVHEQ